MGCPKYDQSWPVVCGPQGLSFFDPGPRRFTTNSMCSDGLDSWFAALPLFGEVSEKNWERLELDYDMEARKEGFDGDKPW